MTYVECPECGRKALSVATRCPHCGVAFPSEPLRRSTPVHRLGRLRPSLVAGGVLLVGVTLVALALPRLRSQSAGESPLVRPGAGFSDSAPAADVPAPIPTAPAAAASAGGAPDATLPSGSSAAPLTPSGDSMARGTPPVLPPAAPPAAATPAPSAPGVQRYARTWVHVRGARTRAAPSVLVLDPGAPVQVDSLSRGWFRVLIEGRAAGYVHRSNLDPVPPPR